MSLCGFLNCYGDCLSDIQAEIIRNVKKVINALSPEDRKSIDPAALRNLDAKNHPPMKVTDSANKVTEAVGQFVDNVKHTSVGQIVTGAPEAIQTVIVTGSRVAGDLYEYGFGNRNAALESLRQHQADNLQLLTIVGQFWRGNGMQGMAAKRPKPVATPEIGSALNKGPVYKTTKEATQAADELGFRKVNETSHGQAVYTDGKIFITRDVDGHNGGAWKGADSVKALSSKDTKAGTFDVNLQRIGD